jgi:hypothetical protein
MVNGKLKWCSFVSCLIILPKASLPLEGYY